jgi:hypothetical protein
LIAMAMSPRESQVPQAVAHRCGFALGPLKLSHLTGLDDARRCSGFNGDVTAITEMRFSPGAGLGKPAIRTCYRFLG